jgi:hypothetical protein
VPKHICLQPTSRVQPNLTKAWTIKACPAQHKWPLPTHQMKPQPRNEMDAYPPAVTVYPSPSRLQHTMVHARAAAPNTVASWMVATISIPCLAAPILCRASVLETLCFLYNLNGMLCVELDISVEDYPSRAASRER